MEWSLKLKMKTRNTRGDYYYGTFRIPKLSFCLTTTMCMLFALTKADHCPAPCTCVYNTRTITCYNSQEIEVPTYLPPWVNAMIVMGYNITTLPEGGFSTNGTELQLFTLTLSKNNIQTIEAYAFVGLPILETLDLSHNRLLSISVQAFYGLGELRFLFLNDSLLPTAALQVSTALTTGSLLNLNRLELSGNQLESIPFSNFDALSLEALILINNSIQAISKESVSRLSEHKEISLYLAQNPFKCDCELESFYNWLKNSSQCPDVHLLVCSEPGNKKGILLEKLRKEDVDCVNAELEAVSYVLLGIVLALIGVVFLMVLYLNREGIKRWLNNIRDACRDQMEVYHYRYEQDSDPRLANVAV